MKSNAEILEEILKKRHSVYPWGYTDQKIPAATIQKIIAASEFTPNHKKTRPWRFRVFEGQEKDQLGQNLANIYKESVLPEKFRERKFDEISNKLTLSSAIISVSVDLSGKVPEWEEVAATMMAVQNMYLMCTALEVGCYFSSSHLVEHLNGFLNLAANQKCIGLFYLGFEKDLHKEEHKKEKKTVFGFFKK